jgi:hypothetical protein
VLFTRVHRDGGTSVGRVVIVPVGGASATPAHQLRHVLAATAAIRRTWFRPQHGVLHAVGVDGALTSIGTIEYSEMEGTTGPVAVRSRVDPTLDRIWPALAWRIPAMSCGAAIEVMVLSGGRTASKALADGLKDLRDAVLSPVTPAPAWLKDGGPASAPALSADLTRWDALATVERARAHCIQQFGYRDMSKKAGWSAKAKAPPEELLAIIHSPQPHGRFQPYALTTPADGPLDRNACLEYAAASWAAMRLLLSSDHSPPPGLFADLLTLYAVCLTDPALRSDVKGRATLVGLVDAFVLRKHTVNRMLFPQDFKLGEDAELVARFGQLLVQAPWLVWSASGYASGEAATLVMDTPTLLWSLRVAAPGQVYTQIGNQHRLDPEATDTSWRSRLSRLHHSVTDSEREVVREAAGIVVEAAAEPWPARLAAAEQLGDAPAEACAASALRAWAASDRVTPDDVTVVVHRPVGTEGDTWAFAVNRSRRAAVPLEMGGVLYSLRHWNPDLASVGGSSTDVRRLPEIVLGVDGCEIAVPVPDSAERVPLGVTNLAGTDLFQGRHAELKVLEDCLTPSVPSARKNVVIFGNRRAGKTTLATHFLRGAGSAMFGKGLVIECSGSLLGDGQDAPGALGEAFARKLGVALRRPGAGVPDQLRSAILQELTRTRDFAQALDVVDELWEDTGLPPVLVLLDEFDTLLNHPGETGRRLTKFVATLGNQRYDHIGVTATVQRANYHLSLFKEWEPVRCTTVLTRQQGVDFFLPPGWGIPAPDGGPRVVTPNRPVLSPRAFQGLVEPALGLRPYFWARLLDLLNQALSTGGSDRFIVSDEEVARCLATMSANDPYLSEMFSAAHDDLDESERMRQDIFSVPELNVLAEFAESNTSHLSRQHLEQSLGVQVAAIGSQGLVDREWADFGKNRTVLLRGSVYMDFLRVNATRMRRYKITPLDKETAAGTGVEGGSPLARRA